MSNKVYESTPRWYAWSTITHNRNVAYKVNVYDNNGKFNVKEKQFYNKKVGAQADLTPKSQTQDSVVVVMTTALSFLYLYSHMFYSILLRT